MAENSPELPTNRDKLLNHDDIPLLILTTSRRFSVRIYNLMFISPVLELL